MNQESDPAMDLLDAPPEDVDIVTVVSGLLIMEHDLGAPDWGFMRAGTPRTSERHLGGRHVRYINTPYYFLNEATVRFMALRPVLRKSGKPYYRWNGVKSIPQIPYTVVAQCGEEEHSMGLLATTKFHKAIQLAFARFAMEEYDLHNHLWRVFKGKMEGHSTGKWGITYLRLEPWNAPSEDPRQPGEASPWTTIPGALRAAAAIREVVLPHYPGQPPEDAFIREIMERTPCDYLLAKALFDCRREVGLL